MEFVIDGQDFSFWCQPYLLKLHFPYRCVDDERAKAQYDIDNVYSILYQQIMMIVDLLNRITAQWWFMFPKK